MGFLCVSVALQLTSHLVAKSCTSAREEPPVLPLAARNGRHGTVAK